MKTERTRRTSRRSGGFTLIEVAIAVAIVGIAVVALLTALASGTRTNTAGQELSQAVFLSQAVREWTLAMPYSELDDLADVTYSPPINSMGHEISDMVGWSQTVTVTYREPEDLNTVVSPGPTDVARIEVDIRRNGRDILNTGWLVTR